LKKLKKRYSSRFKVAIIENLEIIPEFEMKEFAIKETGGLISH